MAHYLVRSRHGTCLYARVVIPRPLRALLGRRELRRSLGTADLRLARLRAAALAYRAAVTFEALMRSRKPGNEDEFMHLILDNVAIDQKKGTFSAERIEIDPQNVDAEIKALEALIAPMGRQAQAASALPTPGSTLSEIIAAFVKEKTATKSWTTKTQQEVESLLGRYNTYCATHGSPFAKETARAFKADALLNHLDLRTVNKHVSRLSSFFEWARQHGYIQDNIFAGLTVRKPKAKASAARPAYSQHDVQALLGSLNPAADARHWLPLLGLYTGARINELAQLHVADIKVVDGIDVFDINQGSTDKQLKNAQSERLVPVHSELITRGLLDHVKALRSKGEKRLFPKFPGGRDGHGQAASRWFQRHRKRHKLQPDFHALRHTCATRLREAGVAEDVVAELLGHSYGASMSFGVYAKASSVGKLKDALEKLRFAEVAGTVT